MDQALKARAVAFAQTIADRLIEVDGVIAVSLGGSWARGTADAGSDHDIGIYYDAGRPPALDSLRALAAEIDDRHSGDVVTPYGEWGQWINGGGWLTIQGRRVDWLYRDYARVAHFVRECAEGRPTIHYQAGHPFGFTTAIYFGEVALTIPLTDPTGALATLKTMTAPYPLPLKQAMIRNLWEAGFSLDTSAKSAQRGDVFHVTGGVFRAASVMTQALFALNERYWINEKGAVAMTVDFPLVPRDYAHRVYALLGTIGESPEQMQTVLADFHALLSEVTQLCENAAIPPIAPPELP